MEWNGDKSLIVMGNGNGNGTTYNEDECSNGVVSKDGFIFQDDLERSVLLCSSLRPVLTALDPCTLNQVRYHHNGRGACLPYQTPKIHDRLICWTCEECVYVCVSVCMCVCERESVCVTINQNSTF